MPVKYPTPYWQWPKQPIGNRKPHAPVDALDFSETESRVRDSETCPVDVITMAEDRLNGTYNEDSFVKWAKEQAADLRYHV